MANKINYPSGIVTSIGTKVLIALLAKGTRILPTFLITVAAPTAQTITPAATTAQSTSISVPTGVPVAIQAGTTLTFGAVPVTTISFTKQGALSIAVAPTPSAITASNTASYTPPANALGNTQIFVAPTPTFLDAGTELSFGSEKVVLTEQASVGSKLLFVASPLVAAITAATNASTKSLLAVVGATDATPASQPKTEDAMNYLSGSGMEKVTIGTDRTLKVSFNRIDGDMGGNLLMQLLYNDSASNGTVDVSLYDREIYALITRPNGEIYEGAAILSSGDATAAVQAKIMQNANFQFQGDSFKFTPGVGNDVIKQLALV